MQVVAEVFGSFLSSSVATLELFLLVVLLLWWRIVFVSWKLILHRMLWAVVVAESMRKSRPSKPNPKTP